MHLYRGDCGQPESYLTALTRNSIFLPFSFTTDNTYALDLLGTQMITVGREVSAAETIAQIEAISTADVKRVANDWVFDKCPAVAATGPIEGLQDYNRLRSGMFWLRV